MAEKNLHICDHPMIEDHLARLRDKDCPSSKFKHYVEQISYVLAYEASRYLPVQDMEIQTPITEMSTKIFAHQQSPIVVPILRAGLGLIKGFEHFFPDAATGHIGVYRDEETKRPVEYLLKLPKKISGRPIFLLDPMLATGHSAIYAVELLIKNGADPKQIIAVFMIAAPEGITEFQNAHPDIQIVCAAMDERLNEKAYIVPGLGDAGDRLFGTD
jgi:uracil phosphoribosyltransferase